MSLIVCRLAKAFCARNAVCPSQQEYCRGTDMQYGRVENGEKPYSICLKIGPAQESSAFSKTT
jgi:hypothetical protein